MSTSDRAIMWEEIREHSDIKKLYAKDNNDPSSVPYAIRDALGKSLSQWEIDESFKDSSKVTFVKKIMTKIKTIGDETLTQNWMEYAKTVQDTVPVKKGKKKVTPSDLQLAIYGIFKRCIIEERKIAEQPVEVKLEYDTSISTSTSTSTSTNTSTKRKLNSRQQPQPKRNKTNNESGQQFEEMFSTIGNILDLHIPHEEPYQKQPTHKITELPACAEGIMDLLDVY